MYECVCARRFGGLLLIFTLNDGFCIYSVHPSGVFLFLFHSLKLDSNVLVYRDKIILNCCRNIRVSVFQMYIYMIRSTFNMRERVNFKIGL